MSVSRETDNFIRSYLRAISGWADRLHLFSARADCRLITKHIHDSLQLVEYIPPNSSVADVGSGNGLPGLALAAMRPDLRVTLIERSIKRCVFLEHVSRETNVEVEVLCQDATKVEGRFSVVVGKAVANVSGMLQLVGSIIRSGGMGLFFGSEQDVPDGVIAKRHENKIFNRGYIWEVKFDG